MNLDNSMYLNNNQMMNNPMFMNNQMMNNQMMNNQMMNNQMMNNQMMNNQMMNNQIMNNQMMNNQMGYNQMNMNNQMMNNNQMNMNAPMMNNQMNMNPQMMYNQANMNMVNFMINYMTLYKLFNKNNNQNNVFNMEIQRKSNTMTNKKSLPRTKDTISHALSPGYNGPRVNISFQTPAGFKVMMSVPENSKIGDILLEYLSVVGLGPDLLGKGIYFLFNGNKIKKADYNQTALQFGISHLSHIIVIDTKNLIGA